MVEDYHEYVQAALHNIDQEHYERAQVAAILAVAEATRKQAEATEALTENIGLLLDRLEQFATALENR